MRGHSGGGDLVGLPLQIHAGAGGVSNSSGGRVADEEGEEGRQGEETGIVRLV